MIVTIGGIPVYDAIISDEETGMMKISLVDDPAVMSNFLAFDADRKPVMYAIQDEERRLVRGVVMRCNFPIYRRDANMGEFYIIYKAETIRQMAEKYLAEGRQNDVNLMHQEGSDVDGVQMVQYFIKGDGIQVDGFDDIADGSLMAEFHILNDEVWNAIKDGTYKGFSLEGVFDLVPEQDKDEIQEIVDILDGAFRKLFKNSTNMSKLSRFKEALAKILAEFGTVTTNRGVIAWDGDEDLKEGDEVFVTDQEGNRSRAEDGEYITEDAKVIVVVDGKVEEIRDAEAEVATQPEEAEQKMGAVNTDKGVISWEGEEDLKEGDAVFVDGEVAADGEYTTEDGKVIVVVDGRVAEIRDPRAEVAPEDRDREEEMAALKAENESLKSQVASLQADVEKFKKMSAAKPAHQEIEETFKIEKTGNRGLDNLARILSAK